MRGCFPRLSFPPPLAVPSALPPPRYPVSVSPSYALPLSTLRLPSRGSAVSFPFSLCSFSTFWLSFFTTTPSPRPLPSLRSLSSLSTPSTFLPSSLLWGGLSTAFPPSFSLHPPPGWSSSSFFPPFLPPLPHLALSPPTLLLTHPLSSHPSLFLLLSPSSPSSSSLDPVSHPPLYFFLSPRHSVVSPFHSVLPFLSPFGSHVFPVCLLPSSPSLSVLLCPPLLLPLGPLLPSPLPPSSLPTSLGVLPPSLPWGARSTSHRLLCLSSPSSSPFGSELPSFPPRLFGPLSTYFPTFPPSHFPLSAHWANRLLGRLQFPLLLRKNWFRRLWLKLMYACINGVGLGLPLR